ncbi:MAG: hypothetical protein HOC93_01705, partial [Phycisphaerae bacterium]|nr:hypothetical protein [Phycisphaerae bacterium]
MTSKQFLSTRTIRVVYSLLVLLVCASEASSQDAIFVNEETKLLASDGASGDYFGYSVAVSGDTIVVGSRYGDDDNGVPSGTAYIYSLVKGVWQETKLTASDGEQSDYFGQSVAISGDTIVVGAFNTMWYQGGAYIYRFDGDSWIEETKLVASDWGTFGTNVSISNDIVVASDDYNYSYIYRFDGASWIETRLKPSDYDYWNGPLSIAVADGIAVVGRISQDGGFDSAYLFNADQDGLMHVPKEHATIDDAMRRALQGSEIILSAGTYTGTGDSVIDTLGKTLTIRSSDGPENTIIDGEGVRRGIACYNE